MWMDDAQGRTLVLGLGNPLMGDDGVGLVALERLRERWELPDDVLLMDGGTWGMNLLPVIEAAERVLFLDAIRHRSEPGSPVVLRDGEIPRALALKLSPHQVDLKDVLAVAQLRGTLPPTVAVGVEPDVVELTTVLTPAVAEAVDDLVRLAAIQLREWGHRCTPRPRSHA